MNWVLIAAMMVLAIFGVVAIYNATWFREGPGVAEYWRRQAGYVGLGMIIFIVVSLTDYRWIKWGALPFYIISIGFLVLTLAIGRTVSGAKSWLFIGPINFQPAQLAVLAGIMVLGLFLSQFRNLHPMLRLACCGAIVGAPTLLILKQPDFGETMMWGPTVMAMLFVGGIPLRYLISIILMGIIALPGLIFIVLKDYQRARITAFLDPGIDPQGSGWAINQSLTAIGSGGWAGKGFKAPNTQVELGFLPSTTVHNDYIFSSIGESWGFIGGLVLLATFAVLLIACLVTAYRASDNLGLLVSTGILALIFTHMFQNIGMTVSLMPITGVPLPLISYSGSFVIVIMFALGIVNSIWVHRKEAL